MADAGMVPSTGALDRLKRLLRDVDTVAVAVSGGVDSLVLGTVASMVLGDRGRMYHAVSPAVPAAATRRTMDLAEQLDWPLDVFDAGEFADRSYRKNPVNRCFFCKVNLYGAIAHRTPAQIISGTNLDDLAEYRPGLDAARRHGVRHPFVEARIDKAAIRAMAAQLGLRDIATLPASPCLSSRVETGIAIDPAVLAMIEEAEALLRSTLAAATIRCRIRARGIVVELDQDALARLGEAETQAARQTVGELADRRGISLPVSIASYRNGSAFLRSVR